MNILEEFYYGNINPNEKCFKRQSEFATFVKIVSDNEEKLIAYLGGEEKHLFSQLMNAQSEILDTEARERFIEGWKLGARFMLDTFITPRYSPITAYVRNKTNSLIRFSYQAVFIFMPFFHFGTGCPQVVTKMK